MPSTLRFIFIGIKNVFPKYFTSSFISQIGKKVLSIYTIYWGGHNLLASMIELCRCALYDLENEGNPECYIHSISGTTIMLRTTDEFKAFFARIEDWDIWNILNSLVQIGTRED